MEKFENKQVVITGMGAVSPFGVGCNVFRESMFGEKSAISDITTYVGDNFPIRYAGKIDPDAVRADSASNGLWKDEVSAASNYAAIATAEALEQAFPGECEVPPFDAIVYGSAEGIAYDAVEKAVAGKLTSQELRQCSAEAPLCEISVLLKNKYRSSVPEERLICVNSACASGNQAIGEAMWRIRAGHWTRAIVGGVDSRCNAPNLMNFHMLSALTTADVPPETASRPFDKTRSGFVRSEGAATLILESAESALARGAKILAVVSGYGATSDAYRLTDGREDGASVTFAMSAAIADGDLASDDISAVSAHGTSTPLNDRLESFAIHQVFGSTKGKTVPVTSLKSQIGHSTVAAGAFETISCVQMLEAQKLAPTLNYKEPDPECDVQVNSQTTEMPLTHILSNNFGFGGQNACLVISRARP